MFKKFLLLFGEVFFLITCIHGQCPDKDSLYKSLKLPINYAQQTAVLQRLDKLVSFDQELRRCQYASDSTHALLLQQIGVLYHKQKKYSKALAYIRFSNNIINFPRNKYTVDPTLLVENYYIMSVILDSLNLFDERMDFLDSCITVFYKFQNRKNINNRVRYVLKALEIRAQSKYDIGEYYNCSKYASRGEVLIRKIYPDKKDSIDHSIYFTTWKVNALLTLGKYLEAEGLLKNKAEECKKYRSYKSLGTIYDLLGQVQIGKKNPDAAINYFHQSLAYDRTYDDRAISRMQTYINLGYYVYEKYYGNEQQALDCYRNGWVCYTTSKNVDESGKMDALNLLTNIANVYVRSRSYDSAFKYFQLALDQVNPGLQESDLLIISLASTPKIEYLTSLLLDKADAYHKCYQYSGQKIYLTKAISVYKITDALLDKIKHEQSDIASKLFWRRDNHRLYEHAIEACHQFGNKTDEAFYFFEKSRAALLNDQLTEQQFLGDQDRVTQAQLQTKIFKLRQQLKISNINSGFYNRMQNDLNEFEEKLDRLLQYNKKGNIHHYQNSFDSASITIRNVQKTILKDHKALVELFEGDSAVYILAVTRKAAWLKRINKADYDSTLQHYLDYISDYSLSNRNTSSYYSAAWHLYNLLFPDQALPAGRIIVSPDGRYIPFEALITSTSKKPAYFVNNYAVSYTYSARYLLILNKYKRKQNDTTQMLLGIAPVTYTYDKVLTDLQQSDQSVRTVQSYFTDADVLTYGQATKENFLKNAPRYKIVYLSTHASDSGSTDEPVIYFADGPLSLSEFVTEKRPATQLVIASACKTGLGQVFRGEGVYNFSRSFASVGIPASVNNLWSVQESAANELTELFCQYIADGEPTDVALQMAKKKMIQTGKNGRDLPYYWAASILSGTTDVIVPKTSRWNMTVMLSLLALFLTVGILLASRVVRV